YKAEGAEVFTDLDSALEVLKDEEVFCIGGASIYKALLTRCERLYITQLFKDYEGDVNFPTIDSEQWRITRLSPILYDIKEDVRFRFEVWEKK
ncbi:MAG: dihydrofolate reductase, partial [Bacteroidales bacterium]|nr:dihydrofolate reductase [Bacteroidales bacterium]